MAGKPKIRSRKHPARSLPGAVAFAKRILTLGGKGVSLASIATDMGLANTNNGRFRYLLSAAKQFGLIDVVREATHITPTGMHILMPTDEEDHALHLVEAIKKPPVYAALLHRFTGLELPPIASLEGIMLHDHGVAPNKARNAAKAFYESVRYVDIFDSDRIIDVFGEVAASEAGEADDVSRQAAGTPVASPQGPPVWEGLHGQGTGGRESFAGVQEEDVQEISVRLPSGGKCFMRLPGILTKVDASKIKQMVDLMTEDDNSAVAEP